MPKRKQSQPDSNMADAGEDSDSGSDTSMLDVDFEWFDPQPAVDFHGLKTLCRQLFDIDNDLFDLSGLVDLILSQPLLGSTVKVDGNESDPYAFLTVINLHQHRDHPAIAPLVKYLHQKCPSSSPLKALLAPPSTTTTTTTTTTTPTSSSSPPQIGLILTERLVNMPAATIPPMYTMLLEEIQWALDDDEPYQFTHYLVLSKTYVEVASKLGDQYNDGASQPAAKKTKKVAEKAENQQDTMYLHPEDEILHQYALEHFNFGYTTVPEEGSSDARRAFTDMGIVTRGHLICLEASKLKDAVEGMSQALGVS